MGEIRLKRAYDKPAKNDGRRVLVDRLWPRGVKKEALELDDWFKEVAPSDDLRRWFGHDPERWEEFRQRYSEELQSQQPLVDDLCSTARQGRLTLVFAASDEEHNNAVALKEYLQKQC